MTQRPDAGGAAAPPASGFHRLATIAEYADLDRMLAEMLEQDRDQWAEFVREQVKVDFYFFGRYVSLSGKIPAPEDSGVARAVDHPYIFHGYQIVQDEPWNVMDVWPRGHWKSMTKSKDLPVWQFILYDGMLAQVIVSVLKHLAEAHLQNLMVELESNPYYPLLWPDLFFEKPATQARPWSYEKGCNQKPGMANPRKEKQFEARGLETPGVGSHFDRMYFDDCEDESTVDNPELIDQAWQNYQLWAGLENESAPGGPQRTHHGTFYGVNGINSRIISEELSRFRHRDCVDPLDAEGQLAEVGGQPLYLSVERIFDKKRSMGENYASQMRGDPKKGRKKKLDPGKLCYFERSQAQRIFREGTAYIVVDPNGFADDSNDQCAILTAVLGADRNIYVVDFWLGRPSPIERVDAIIAKHRRWFRPHDVFIEEVAHQADSAWIMQRQAHFNHRFGVRSVQVPRHILIQGKKRGLKKFDRLYRAIQPLLEEGRLWIPSEFWEDMEGREVDYTKLFLKELDDFPFSRGVNMLAALALLFAQGEHIKAAPELVWPMRLPKHGLAFDEHGYPIDPDFYGYTGRRNRGGNTVYHAYLGGR